MSLSPYGFKKDCRQAQRQQAPCLGLWNRANERYGFVDVDHAAVKTWKDNRLKATYVVVNFRLTSSRRFIRHR